MLNVDNLDMLESIRVKDVKLEHGEIVLPPIARSCSARVSRGAARGRGRSWFRLLLPAPLPRPSRWRAGRRSAPACRQQSSRRRPVLLVVGLGNPGQKYATTRHNVGFMVVDLLAERFKAGAFREKFSGVFTRSASPDVALLKPHTFMNLSGESVQPAMQFFKVELKDVLVVHDELDLPFGECRLKRAAARRGTTA